MTPEALALAVGLSAAVTLALANTMVKASGDILMSRAAMSGSAAIMCLPLAFIVPLPDMKTWLMLGLSIPAHAIYQAALIRAMSRGDLSLVFPVMRGSAPLITALFAFLSIGEAHSPLAITGLVIASAATIFFALPENGFTGDIKTKRTALFWALITGGCIALYNVIDAIAVRGAPTALTFIVWLFLLDSISINTAALWTRRTAWFEGMKLRWKFGLIAGASTLISFGLTLYGFSIADVTLISALRETSVVFAALFGWRMLKEGLGGRRMIAAAALAGGLILFQAG